jgi:RNA polymerase sigma-70 factor (ECF subfamily)
VWLRRVEELSQKEVARRLGISEKTVEKHIAKGMRLLADALYGARELPSHDALWDDHDAQRHAD